MASIAPTPQQQHMSPPHRSQQPYYSTNTSMTAYDSSSQTPSYAQSFPNSQTTTYPNGPVSGAGAGYSRSFGEDYNARRALEGKPQIYTAVYSGVSVYEMEINGIACMRRRSDGCLNATQILKVAGVDKGKRTKVLEKEILTGEHEKVQGGYGKYQGTWISYKRGREFCRQYGVEDILRPLLDYDVKDDGSGLGGAEGTPTKEQAMAANRKRFYTTSSSSAEPARQGPMSNGTFFSNISPTTSVALAAINKANRMNSPAPRSSGLRRPSSQQLELSQQSDSSFVEGKADSGYAAQPNGEPPRKRMRPDSQDGMAPPPGLPLDASMRSITPTEVNESFLYDPMMSQQHDAVSLNSLGEPIALAPLPTPSTPAEETKMNLILDLFADTTARTDYTSHPALTQLSGEDLNIPLDASANNALHWAATLAKIPLLTLLIKRGANIFRGNAAGQSPLVSAVLVNNCWEQSCFPELLELLGGLIEIRDVQGRTILHHIAVSSGIKGRAPSSKYYLEALLEFLVRIGPGAAVPANHVNGDGGMSSQESLTQPAPTAPIMQSSKGAVTLVRFLSHIVNARDKAGNTALNLVARIGNRSIIHQLLEIHADPSLPNYKGVSAKDFGIGIENGEQASLSQQPAYVNGGSQSSMPSTYPLPGTSQENGEAGGAAGSQVEELGADVISSMTSMLTQSLASHKDLLKVRTEQIDQLNAQIRDFSAMQKQDLERLQEVKERVRVRGERQAKIANLKRSIAEKKKSQSRQTSRRTSSPLLDTDPDSSPSPSLSPRTLRALLATYHATNTALQQEAEVLKSKSSELEAMYRKVVHLCTNVPEERVEDSLPSLVAAVESEKGDVEVGRAREFLRRVEG